MRTLTRLTSLVAIVVAVGMTACERRLTNANLGHVKPEMTVKEVEAILGPPTRIEASPEAATAAASLTPAPDAEPAESARQSDGTPGKDSVVRYIYQQQDKTISLTFVGNRLAPNGIAGSFD